MCKIKPGINERVRKLMIPRINPTKGINWMRTVVFPNLFSSPNSMNPLKKNSQESNKTPAADS